MSNGAIWIPNSLGDICGDEIVAGHQERPRPMKEVMHVTNVEWAILCLAISNAATLYVAYKAYLKHVK